MAAEPTPLVAILRGVEPTRVVAVASAIRAEGIRSIEVPLNSPDPFRSIELLAAEPGLKGALIGAGTVLTTADVGRTHSAGGRLVVTPNCDIEVIAAALRLGMTVMPGIATPTEALLAIRAGATNLKLFPAVSLGPRHLRAMSAVLPPMTGVYPVGGVGGPDIYEWLAAGAAGFGFGSELFKPDYALEDIAARARYLVEACREAQQRLDEKMAQ